MTDFDRTTIIDNLSIQVVGSRKVEGLTQEQVASKLGITQQAYSVMEKNVGRIRLDKFIDLADILGFEVRLYKKEK